MSPNYFPPFSGHEKGGSTFLLSFVERKGKFSCQKVWRNGATISMLQEIDPW
jgi:hypothetical protein